MTNISDPDQNLAAVEPVNPTLNTAPAEPLKVRDGGWYTRVVVLTFVSFLGLEALLAGTVFGAALVGVVCLYVGTFYGLGALIAGAVLRYRAGRADRVLTENAYSRFATIPQVAGLFLNAALIVVLLFVTLIYSQRAEGWTVWGALLGPGFGTALIVLSFQGLLSKQAANGEVFALSNRLPAAKLIRAAGILRWAAYVLVVAVLAFLFSGIQLPGDALYPAQQFYAAVPPATAGSVVASERINGLEAIDTEPRLGYRVLGDDAYDRYVAAARAAGATCKTTGTRPGSRFGNCVLNGTTVSIQEFEAGGSSILGNEQVGVPGKPGIDLNIDVARGSRG